MGDDNPRHYFFEGYQLDVLARELRDAQGAVQPLNARAFDALCLLIRHRDRIVGKDELLETVWPGRVVEENTLTQAISLLRRALGAGGGDHRYIVTVPGHGYRFVAEVSEADTDAGAKMRRAEDLAVTAGAEGLDTPAPPETPPAVDNKRRNVLLVALVLAGSVAVGLAWRASAPVVPVASRAKISLAVLPFRSLSAGPRDELLELGLAETLITRLSRSGGLQVRSLTSSQRLSDAQQGAMAGRLLGTAYVIEGTTQRAGDQVRVNARLVSVASDQTVWADTFDARSDRVFTLQDKISDAVTSALALAPVVLPVAARSPCDGADAIAYRAYLRGQYQLGRPDAARMIEALAAFREAIDRDPTCARAWAGTAVAYRALVMTGDRDPKELFPLAKAAVARALAIDPNSAEAYTEKGFIEFWYDWDWPRSEASLRHAIRLNPNLATAQIALAHLLVNIGRADEALPYARRAIALDPLSPLVNSLAGSFIRSAGEIKEAEKHLQKTLELEPDAWVALRVSSARAQARGDRERAERDLRRAVAISGGHSNTLAALGKLYAAYGDRAAAERVQAELEERRSKGYLPATSLAVMANALGDTGRTLDLLEQGYRERDVRMSFLLQDWPGLRAQPRYQVLLGKMRLQAPPTAHD